MRKYVLSEEKQLSDNQKNRFVPIEELEKQKEYALKVKDILASIYPVGYTPFAYVHSYGCQQNVSDGEKIKGILFSMGYQMTDDVKNADFVIYNTCAVREHAEQRGFGNVGALKNIKRHRPNMIIGLCGCMTQQEIIRILKSNYDMDCDRRSVKNNVLYLKELGYEISMEDGYYLISRKFEDAELRMLIDSVLFSKSMTHKQARVLIDKLRSMGNRYFSAKVSHVYNLPELHHSENKQLLYVLDAINDAITEKKKISFVYNEYGKDFKLHPKRDAKYIVNPYQIVANNGFYYLVGNYDKYDNVSHYRLDRMTEVVILDEKVKPKENVIDFANGYNLPKHMAEHIYMFGGPSIRVKLLVPESMMNEMVDWFGKDFRVSKSKTEGMMEIVVSCNESAMFFWALQYGVYVEVVEPVALREKLKEAVDGMSRKYSHN